MITALLGTLAVSAVLVDGPPPPITVSLNNGGQYNRGEWAQVQFKAAADGYVVVLQADGNGRVRVLFPLDPGDDNFIRGGKNYAIVGRDSRGSFYLDQAGGGGMVYAAWSKSPFQLAGFMRGDHWDFSVFDQFNAANDPEATMTDLVLQMTAQGFDYSIDRYVVYTAAEVAADNATYIGVGGWPWPTYYADGWSIGVSFGFGCCYYDPWPYYGYGWYPAYGYYPWYGYGYYPGYPWYGHAHYPAYGYPGYGYPGYGYGYSRPPGYYSPYGGYTPYTFKPGGTVTDPGIPYRPRGGAVSPSARTFQAGGFGASGLGTVTPGRRTVDAASINGTVAAGRRPIGRPENQPTGGSPIAPSGRRGLSGASDTRLAAGTPARPRPTLGQPSGTTPSPSGRRGLGGSADSRPGADAPSRARPTMGEPSGAAPRARPQAGIGGSGGAERARGWGSDGARRPVVTSRSPESPAVSPGRRDGSGGGLGLPEARGSNSSPSRSGGQAGSSRPSGRSTPSYSAPSSGGSRAAPSGGGARAGGGASHGGGGARAGGAPSGGGGGGRRGR